MNRTYDERTTTVLQELATLAFKRELEKELVKLEEAFRQWHSQHIDAFELSDAIHRFHNGRSLDLSTYYSSARPDMAVTRAITTGVVKKSEVPLDVYRHIKPIIDFYEAEHELK